MPKGLINAYTQLLFNNDKIEELDLSRFGINNINDFCVALCQHKALKILNLFETLDLWSKVSKLNLFFQGKP